jgi:hypothetical protein
VSSNGKMLALTSPNPLERAIEQVASKQRLDLRVGDWGFSLNLKSGKFEVYRAGRHDLAHLTVAWRTGSGDIDVHLTFGHEAAMRGAGKKRWVPVFKIPRASLEAAGVHVGAAAERVMLPHLRRNYRRFRPGWLAHRSYFVTVAGEEPMLDWLLGIAPRKRGKYRFESRRLLDPEAYPPELVDGTYDPRVLHWLEDRERRLPVSALRVRRRQIVRADGILLYYVAASNVTAGWYGIKQRDVQSMSRETCRSLFDSIVPLVKPEHADKWDQIVSGLGMDDHEGPRELSHGVRQFLRAPRNPIGQAAERGEVDRTPLWRRGSKK